MVGRVASAVLYLLMWCSGRKCSGTGTGRVLVVLVVRDFVVRCGVVGVVWCVGAGLPSVCMIQCSTVLV